MSDDLNRQIFKEEAYDLLGELEGALLELEESPEDMDLVNRVFRTLHTIKGSGSMFGFDDIAEFTHEVETVLDLVRSEELNVSTDLISLVFRARDQIQKMLDNAGSDVEIAPEEMESILAGLKRLVANEPVEDAAPEAPAEAAPEEQAGEEIPEPEAQSAPNYFILRIAPRSEGAADRETLEPVLSELERLGELSVRTGPGDVPGVQGWEIRLDTPKGEDDIQDIFLFTDADIDIEVTQYAAEEEIPAAATHVAERTPEPEESAETTESVETQPEAAAEEPAGADIVVEASETPEAPEKVEDTKPSEPTGGTPETSIMDEEEREERDRLGDILVRKGVVKPEDVDSAVKDQKKSRETAASKQRQEAVSSIRVAAEKLDYLVDLVGELVIVQAQISQVVSERSDPTLTGLSEELERLSDELRDSTLGIRMLPIGTTFSKFRRLVRDLSADLGKEITLSTNGAETELDKTVIERLNDPLVHLLRNSIDHGIEQPAEREASGKPRSGMILLSAEHSGGEVLIRITDDGKGMDPDVIRAKAVERELIAPDADLSRKEIFKLIFEAGFSTADKVTNVSGRGVGMDVVKRAIDSLRGTIDIDSAPGKGTTITVRLPLTLAIIDGLQVRVEDEYYVIPLSLVEECVELSNVDRNEDESGQRIMYLRGEIVPYVHLREFFEVEGESPPIEQIVITGVEGSRIGIVVDTVIGEHQTVIKSLSRVYKDVEGISGATIKGDGSIALILDIPRLVRRIVAESNLN